MNERTRGQVAANLRAATAHLLTGAPGNERELNDRLAIMVGLSHPNLPTLLAWADWVRAGGRPIVHLSFPHGGHVPSVALVAVLDGQARIFEGCELWLSADGGRAAVIPDSYAWGAYAVARTSGSGTSRGRRSPTRRPRQPAWPAPAPAC